MQTMATEKLDGQKIRDLRLAKGWSQRKLAQETGLAYETVNRIERTEGRPVYDHTAARLANALGVDVANIRADQLD